MAVRKKERIKKQMGKGLSGWMDVKPPDDYVEKAKPKTKPTDMQWYVCPTCGLRPESEEDCVVFVIYHCPKGHTWPMVPKKKKTKKSE